MGWRIVVYVLLLGLPAGMAGELSQAQLDAYADRASIRYRQVQPRGLAFYYPWYGGRQANGEYLHWKTVDLEKQSISESPHYPQLGPYDSLDAQVMAQHCAWAKEAGLDGFIVSWWGKGRREDRALEGLLSACQEAGLFATIYYETVPRDRDGVRSATAAADDLLYLLHRYGAHPAWLKARSKPVVFIYGRAIGELGRVAWLDVITRVSRRYPPGVAFLGDDLSRQSAGIFDGIHTYNPADRLRGKRAAALERWAAEKYPEWVELADRAGKISTLTIIPGYDDTKLADRPRAFAVERYDGDLYRVQWEAALAARPDWVLITSFNEWHEGSEIEPSREYGDKYLQLTAQYAARLKAMAKRKGAAAGATSITAREREALARRLPGRSMAVLPNGESRALWWLLEQGIKPTLVSWREVARGELTPARFRYVLYAGGEDYRATVNSAGDVDAGLRGYLSAGGAMVVLPDGPMPFYYDEEGRVVNRSAEFGLPLEASNGGWETPPGVDLRFIPKNHALPHLLKYFGFPKEGERRWRPLWAERIPVGGKCTPLVEVEDSEGKHYGTAAAYIEYSDGPLAPGRILYAWYGLLDHPKSDELLFDLFQLLVAKTEARESPGRPILPFIPFIR
ncbi:hypothetical protein HS125_15680 [bacterium]|nr:hypothetical protein [bacterium]